ncbi:unnamed protein product (mitochondrion) [Plasmodiophora brassicae]|uniref:RxLR effector candidate protein n=1 Tax=Plasmodiophora brassicae TaxID=37360 RepID=A0A3P3YDH8_PLABS|nr:unnamed protein product [Plasmodiophora brassicae]
MFVRLVLVVLVLAPSALSARRSYKFRVLQQIGPSNTSVTAAETDDGRPAANATSAHEKPTNPPAGAPPTVSATEAPSPASTLKPMQFNFTMPQQNFSGKATIGPSSLPPIEFPVDNNSGGDFAPWNLSSVLGGIGPEIPFPSGPGTQQDEQTTQISSNGTGPPVQVITTTKNNGPPKVRRTVLRPMDQDQSNLSGSDDDNMPSPSSIPRPQFPDSSMPSTDSAGGDGTDDDQETLPSDDVSDSGGVSPADPTSPSTSSFS